MHRNGGVRHSWRLGGLGHQSASFPCSAYARGMWSSSSSLYGSMFLLTNRMFSGILADIHVKDVLELYTSSLAVSAVDACGGRLARRLGGGHSPGRPPKAQGGPPCTQH